MSFFLLMHKHVLIHAQPDAEYPLVCLFQQWLTMSFLFLLHQYVLIHAQPAARSQVNFPALSCVVVQVDYDDLKSTRYNGAYGTWITWGERMLKQSEYLTVTQLCFDENGYLTRIISDQVRAASL